ncbi:MAG: hypothetical protein EHM20_08930 [Alphaproteobacteria bacterium]|nr:MAG: hypothetical protein EHM20_08930 [Alphaproteobacteria bacterium]
MNQFLQNNLVAIVVFLLLLIFVLMGTMIFILFKLLVRPKPEAIPPTEKPALKPIFEKIRLAEEVIVEKYYCIHHKQAPSVGSCLICEEVFCADCLVEHESMHFCKEHFRTFANYKWKQITDERTTPDTPEDGLYIYNFKRDLWLNKNIPSFVMTHYKINIENDFIESFIQLNVREEDVEKLSRELELFKR